jgi:AraC-like DNA-binding protein
MPLYMDIHTVDSDSFSVEDVVKAHMQDLAVEKKFGVTQRKYWVNEKNKTIFCLMEGPNKDSCNAVHKESHGLTACNIIEVSDDEYHLFLGIGEKNEVDLAHKLSGEIDEGYRTILLLNHFDFTGRYDHLIKKELALIEENKGTVILEPNEDIMISFVSATNAIQCAQSLAELLNNSEDNFEFRIGLVTGSPVDEEGTKIFEETKKNVNQLCLIGLNGSILLDETTKLISSKEGSTYNFNSEEFKILKTEDFKFLNSLILIVNKNLFDTNFNSEKLNTALGLSKSQAYRNIKALTGLATNELIQELKLRYALRALKNNDKTVAEIGYGHGFNSPTYFSRVFRKRFGLSPTSYTKLFKTNH